MEKPNVFGIKANSKVELNCVVEILLTEDLIAELSISGGRERRDSCKALASRVACVGDNNVRGGLSSPNRQPSAQYTTATVPVC